MGGDAQISGKEEGTTSRAAEAIELDSKQSSLRILILGAGPCGLGAATRLAELKHPNWQLLEARASAGGLARTDTDENGFKWDVGGHVLFSHYDYFDDVLDVSVDEYNVHGRNAFVWMRGRFIPYPLQNHVHMLPREDVLKCLEGLADVANLHDSRKPANFEEWLKLKFGEGLYDVFLGPYNFKVWGYKPKEMNVEWMGERVAPLDFKSILRSVVFQEDEGKARKWGPNSVFRYPRWGGTGAIWEGVCRRLPQSNVRLEKTVEAIKIHEKTVVLQDGEELSYDVLITTMPLNAVCNSIDIPPLKQAAEKLRYSTTHVVGLGMKGIAPDHLKEKAWLYFPESNSPYYRATVLSNYSEDMTPARACVDGSTEKAEQYWSLMFEVSETGQKPVDRSLIVQQTISSAIEDQLIKPDAEIVSKYYQQYHMGYPTPFYGRDECCRPIFEELQKHDIYARGRFGAWKYEISNQDHSFMQGVEAVDSALKLDSFFAKEMTFYNPAETNSCRHRSAIRYSFRKS